jgi:hypothetical protein
MATRRTIDSLVEEFASIRGVSNDNAVRIALMEAIAREEEPEPEISPVAKEIMMRRVWIAYMEGQDGGSHKVLEDMTVPCVFSTLVLILSLFAPGVRFGFVGVAIIVSTLSLYYFHRSIEKSKDEHSKNREALYDDIAEMEKKVPSGLEFLADGPTYMDVIISSLEEQRRST